MVILVIVIFAKGGAPTTGIDFSVFSFSGGGVTPSAVLAGVVAAFLSWAGFEACASMGEETDNPGRNIPRALAGTLLLTGVLFVVVMFAQVDGFGTDQAGLDAFQSSGNTLGDLGNTYVGQWFGLVVIFTAIVSAFGCHLATSATSGRMLYAFARDGFGPKALAHIHAATGGPRRATWLVVGVALVVNLICAALGWPDMGTGNDAIDTYFLFAVAGSVCLMVCYLLVEIAAAWFVGAPKFLDVHGGKGKALGLVLPLLGALVIVVVLWFNVKDAETWSAAPLLGLYWCIVGLVIALAASGIAKRVGESLSAELNLTSSEHALRAGRSLDRGHREAAVLPARGGVRARLDTGHPRRSRTARPVGHLDGQRARATATPRSSRRSAGRCARRRARADFQRCIPIPSALPRICWRWSPAPANDGSTWDTRDLTRAMSPCGPAGTRRAGARSIAFEHSYHGGVGVAMGVSGVHVDAGATPDADVVFLPYPNPFRPAGRRRRRRRRRVP